MINYNELYELLRKEKYSESLQVLPKNFLNEFSDFLAEMRGNTVSEGNLFADAVAKSKKQFENSISIFKELILRRKRKIIDLVFVATETGIMKRDYENMLPFEKEVFDKMIKAFEEGDKEMNSMLHEGKEKVKGKQRMIMFNQEVEQFVDLNGKGIGPYSVGELVNLDTEVAQILVSGGKASYVDEE